MDLGSRWAGLSFSETAGLLEFSHTTFYIEFTQNGINNTENPVSEGCAGGITLLLSVFRGECPVWSEVTGSQIRMLVRRTISQNTQHIKPWGGSSRTADHHIRFHSCHLRKRIWGYHWYKQISSPLIFNCPLWVNLRPKWSHILIRGWPKWNLGSSPAVVAYPPKCLIFGACWKAFVLTWVKFPRRLSVSEIVKPPHSDV